MQEILSVSELTSAIKKNLESRFPSLSVKGEVSNLKEQASGHLYFTLKDHEAQVSAVLFRGNARDLKRLPKNGDQIIVHGEINVYPPRGYYQIVVRKLEYAGVGELLLQLQQLKEKLEKLGWFDAAKKKPLPKFPKTIGVVTSPTGSVIQDILQILSRRFSGFHLILNPVKVQGEGAAAEIAQAIDQFNRYGLVDVLIVGRGGGSLEDLWAFNEEKVAAAIFLSKIPVISAVGHETDFSIADFVADVRAPTPSAAAELATQETAQQLHGFTQTKARLSSFVVTSLKHHRKQLENLRRHPCLASPLSILEPHLQRLDDLRSDLDLCLKRCLQDKQLRLLALKKQAHALKPSSQIQTWKQKLAVMAKTLQAAMMPQLAMKSERLSQLASHLQSIDPKNLLTKGYCILFQEKKDSVILSTQELNAQDKVRLQLQDGKVHLTVDGIQ
jgi:exodeoxyribonuclease VII large subunit